MEQQIISTALVHFTRLFGEESNEVTVICDRIKRKLQEFVKSEEGQGLIRDFEELGRAVSNKKGFWSAIKNFFHSAKEWSPSPIVMLAIFLLCIAGLTVYIVCVPQSTVAVWVTSLLSCLAAIFAELGRKVLAEKIAEFFARPSLELPN